MVAVRGTRTWMLVLTPDTSIQPAATAFIAVRIKTSLIDVITDNSAPSTTCFPNVVFRRSKRDTRAEEEGCEKEVIKDSKRFHCHPPYFPVLDGKIFGTQPQLLPSHLHCSEVLHAGSQRFASVKVGST
jgi:hypothetical protein